MKTIEDRLLVILAAITFFGGVQISALSLFYIRLAEIIKLLRVIAEGK